MEAADTGNRTARATWLVLGLVALALVVFTKSGAGSWADASRLATIESLAERGTLAIDDSVYFWQGDRVRFDGRYYSHQPPMLAILGAGPYRLLHTATGLSIDDAATYRLLTWLLVGLPVLLGLWALGRLLGDFGVSPQWTAALVALAAVGTLLFPYALVLNQHAPAAGLVLAALLAARRGWPALAGALAALATCIDLTAVFFLVAVALPVWASAGPVGILRYGLGALPPLALHFSINHAIAGDFLPFGLHVEAFRYPLSTFLLQSLTGAAGRDGAFFEYARVALVGESGLFAYHPWLLLAVLAGVVLLRPRLPRTANAAVLVAVGAASLGVVLYYLTSSRNLGGSSFGMRWFAVFAPALALFPGAWIAARERGGRPWTPMPLAWWLAVPLVVVSVAGAALGAINPWAKFSWRHETSPRGITGLEEAPPSRIEHLRREWKRIRYTGPIDAESYEANYLTLLDQHRRFYLQPAPQLDAEARAEFVGRGLKPLLEVAAVLDEERSTSEVRPIAHFWIGKFHAAMGNTIAARASYERVLQLRPGYPAAQTALLALGADSDSPR
ncbi:MAG: hypothetical protein GC161_00745 [Planctomycetaceae bacterium]|nr:hypothetical protein [Planctomycetaceae bacterium]